MKPVTIYSDHCSSNPTVVPFGKCTTMTAGSFSVDCLQINGTLDRYTTFLAASDQTSTLLSQQEPTTSTCPFATSSATICASAQISTSMSKDSSPSSPPQLSSSLLSDLQSTSSFPSSSPSPTSKQSGNNERPSKTVKIILGVVIPFVTSIVLIYGIFWYVRRRRSATPGPQSSVTTADGNFQRSSSSYPMDHWDYVRRDSRDSDRLTLDNENPSIPPYHQGRI